MSRKRKQAGDPIFGTIEIAGHRLPGIWQYMLPEEFTWLRLPMERRATCEQCPKIITNQYRKDCRCCTYFPHLPNFMIGLGLKDPAAADLMMKLIDGGYTVPEGTPITPGRLDRTTALYCREQFGRNPTLICPLLTDDGARCGIYAYRNSVCATFFCEADHGLAGVRFWEKVQAVLGQAETALAQWCMRQVGIDLDAYIDALNRFHTNIDAVTEPETGAWTETARQALFGDWIGREAQLFEQCAELVMENREKLYNIACEQELRVAFEYERAVEEGLDKAQLAEMDRLPENPGEPVRVANLWYQLQLAARRLWALPFNEADVRLNPEVTIADNPRDDLLSCLHRESPFFVFVPKNNNDEAPLRLFLSEAEAVALRLFETPRVIGESLLALPEMQTLDDAKGRLAEWMRRRILIV